MDRIERIEAMEEKLNAALAAIGALERALEDYAAVREDVRALDAYLSGAEWREDFAADEAGLLPDGLRRGVLSEDGIYGMLEENAALRREIRALADSFDES